MGIARGDWDGLDGMQRELARLSRKPSAGTRAKLEAALAAAFAQTQADVHVHTGMLRATGRTSSEWDDLGDQWEGTIEYGPDPAATAELHAGGDHDYLRNVVLHYPMFEEAVASHFDDDPDD